MTIDQWKTRGAHENALKARRLVHEANTNLEYGEKTWTTGQTVRDLMQNHLDAETDVYYRAIAASLFDESYLKSAEEENGNGSRKKREELLHAAYLFARHAGDMSPVARAKSESHLRELSVGLPVKDEMREHDEFSSSQFLEAVRDLPEARPAVSFEVRDSETGASLGWIPYEALESEETYREHNGAGYRYAIEGMKVVDRGAGFDSQLTSLYISSKTGKKHLRGKFGEGAKMSELHLLRNGASMKMRSSYNAINGDNVERNRTWQTRPLIVDGRLVSKGVELQRDGAGETGSMVAISIKNAGKTFRREFLDNVDPRVGGLGKNIAEFRKDRFAYPMPVSEKHLAGVDITGNGAIQYVQGLRVELPPGSSDYARPCYSYDFLDPDIIAGRDRNEIKTDITKRIPQLWYHADNPALIKALVHTAVHDKERLGLVNRAVPEIRALDDILCAYQGVLQAHDGNVSTRIDVERIQKIVDAALVEELELQRGVPTMLMSDAERLTEELQEVLDYAYMEGYEVKRMAASLGHGAMRSFVQRLPAGYKARTLYELRQEMKEAEKSGDPEQLVEGEREKAIREVFNDAVASLRGFIRQLGLPPATFEMTFAPPDKTHRGGDDDAYALWMARRRREKRSPVAVFEVREEVGFHVQIHADDVLNPSRAGNDALQRQIEIYLLNAYGENGPGDSDDKELMLKHSQRLLDNHIPALIPKDSALLATIPPDMGYQHDRAAFKRLWDAFADEVGLEREKAAGHYATYRRALKIDASMDEFKEMQRTDAADMHALSRVLRSRTFVSEGAISFLDERGKKWETHSFKDLQKVTEWRGLPAYKLGPGRFFVRVPMSTGAVLVWGEGKKREYTFENDGALVRIGEYGVGFSEYDVSNSERVAVHPDGLLITRASQDRSGDSLDDARYVVERLSGYRYYPTGEGVRGSAIIEGVMPTSIPVEYGQDEWDNPVRVFEDIIQNHVDASENNEPVQLTYEVERGGERVWTHEAGMHMEDKIVGLRVEDEGAGYYPNEIATMGATSKRSPLFAGKYGEGQKMVAAAALRSGLELTYESQVRSEGAGRWRAQAVREARGVVLDGMEVEKQLVAFDVKRDELHARSGSVTTLRLPEGSTSEQEAQWEQWVSIVDPREKDERGYGGLSRYIRQLRAEGTERVHRMGSISILLDEPGAVYENGIRIHPQGESGRNLSFGYDVPEVVTTRERNSFNHDRLRHYAQHVMSHTTEQAVIQEVLNKAVSDGPKPTTDTNLEIVLYGDDTATPVWAQVARKMWPDRLLHSSEQLRRKIAGQSDVIVFDAEDEARHVKEMEEAVTLLANMRHIENGRLFDVSPKLYDGLSRLLPTAKDFIGKLTNEVLPAPPAVRAVLSRVVAESVTTLSEMFREAEGNMTREQLRMYPLMSELVRGSVARWGDARVIEERDGVAIAPFGAPYHGKAEEKGVVFNEELLLPGQERNLAHIGLHESAHLVSRASDYTEEFVEVLYELCRHLAGSKR